MRIASLAAAVIAARASVAVAQPGAAPAPPPARRWTYAFHVGVQHSDQSIDDTFESAQAYGPKLEVEAGGLLARHLALVGYVGAHLYWDTVMLDAEGRTRDVSYSDVFLGARFHVVLDRVRFGGGAGVVAESEAVDERIAWSRALALEVHAAVVIAQLGDMWLEGQVDLGLLRLSDGAGQVTWTGLSLGLRL